MLAVEGDEQENIPLLSETPLGEVVEPDFLKELIYFTDGTELINLERTNFPPSIIRAFPDSCLAIKYWAGLGDVEAQDKMVKKWDLGTLSINVDQDLAEFGEWPNLARKIMYCPGYLF